METNFTFNGVSTKQFEEAINTVCDYFNGIAATPLTEDIHPALIMTGFQGMILDRAHKNYIRKLVEFKTFLEARRGDGSKTESAHIMNSNN